MLLRFNTFKLKSLLLHFIVLGLIEPNQLGVTLTHEHLCIDYAKAFFQPWAGDEDKIENDFQLKNLGWIRQFP